MSRPLSNEAQPGSKVVMLVLFGLVGLVFLFPIFILPLVRTIRARGWNETPCVIVRSTVLKDTASGGPLYGVDIVYRYTVGKRQYEGTRANFKGGLSRGYGAKAATVERYPAGRQSVCYVDPDNPKDSVLDRSFTADAWVIAVVLVLIGAFALRMATSRHGLGRLPQPQWQAGALQPAVLQSAADFNAVPSEQRELKPSATPGLKLGVSGGAALVFGGMTWAAFSQFRGSIDLGYGLLALLFGVLALFMVVAFISSCLALFNPRVHLTLTPGAIRPGEEFSLEWRILGRAGALSRFRILLEGKEIIPGRNEESSLSEVFSHTELVDSTERSNFAAGLKRDLLPLRTMHSFDSGSSKIAWAIRVECEIPRWPGIRDEYPLVVLPGRKRVHA